MEDERTKFPGVYANKILGRFRDECLLKKSLVSIQECCKMTKQGKTAFNIDTSRFSPMLIVFPVAMKVICKQMPFIKYFNV
jgi:hypothetical protein